MEFTAPSTRSFRPRPAPRISPAWKPGAVAHAVPVDHRADGRHFACRRRHRRPLALEPGATGESPSPARVYHHHHADLLDTSTCSRVQMMPNHIFAARLSLFGHAGGDGRGLDLAVCAAWTRSRFSRSAWSPGARAGEGFRPRGGAARAAALARNNHLIATCVTTRSHSVGVVALSKRRAMPARKSAGGGARRWKDVRIIIDSMDDIGRDLMLALGSWREHAMAQLRRMTSHWSGMRSPRACSVPTAPSAHDPDRAALRRSALTNAVSMRDPRSRIAVKIGPSPAATASIGCITVEDDGKGFDVPRRNDPPDREEPGAQLARPCEAARRSVARSWC